MKIHIKRFCARLHVALRLFLFGSEKLNTHGWHAPRMLRFSIALIFSLAAAGVLAVASFLLLTYMRGGIISLSPLRLSGKELTSSDIYDLIRSTIAIAGLTAGVFAAVYAYRKQRIEEAASRRADSEHLSTRYQNAADQLGNDKAPVRLAGVHALTRLADEWLEQRQTCIDVLCSYYRMYSEGQEMAPGEREVRETILSSITKRLHNDTASSWRGYEFNLSRAYFETDLRLQGGIGASTYFDISDATFVNGNLVLENHNDDAFGSFIARGAIFKGTTTVKVSGWYKDGVIDFRNANLDGGRFDLTYLRVDGGKILFQEARFHGASVYFSGSRFIRGYVRLDRAVFDAGSVDFSHVEFGSSVASFAYASYGSASPTFEDVDGERPRGVPPNLWQPRKSTRET